MKSIKLCLACFASVLLLAGCSKSDLKADLKNARLSNELPQVTADKARYLSEADDAVYEQQLAACELYYEAYENTNTSDYKEIYKDKIKPERIAYYCNERRMELNLDISTQLHDNVYEIIKLVEDCDNFQAYLDRVEFDAKSFSDYYAEYLYSDDTDKALCKILKTFYERSNILAFMFMSEHEEEFVDAALGRIIENSAMNSDYSMYISENNELIKALNTVYGGVDGEYVSIITDVHTKLIRKMLEHDSDLDEESINTLMAQLGEPTPEPTMEPTPEPTEVPMETPSPTPNPMPTVVIPTTVPTQTPVRTPIPVPTRPNETYIFGN